MDELNGLRNESIKLYDLVVNINKNVAAWVSEDVSKDEDASARTVCFTNLQDYATHILKRKFGITGDNPNGIVFPEKSTGELLYTGIVLHNTTVDNYKVYAMPYEKIYAINCKVGVNKSSTAVKRYLRLSEKGTVHEF